MVIWIANRNGVFVESGEAQRLKGAAGLLGEGFKLWRPGIGASEGNSSVKPRIILTLAHQGAWRWERRRRIKSPARNLPGSHQSPLAWGAGVPLGVSLTPGVVFVNIATNAPAAMIHTTTKAEYWKPCL